MAKNTGKKSHFDYYAAFEQIGTYADDEADKLLDILTNFNPNVIEAELAAMHEIENAADQVNHHVFTSVVTEFITPIDREDIIELTQELDEVVDRVEDILQHVYMLNIQQVTPEVLEMVRIIAKSTEALHLALVEFPNYKKSPTIKQYLIDVNTYEEDADKLYIESLRKLYVEKDDPTKTIALTKLFDRLERACDSCEHAADLITTICMKNS